MALGHIPSFATSSLGLVCRRDRHRNEVIGYVENRDLGLLRVKPVGFHALMGNSPHTKGFVNTPGEVNWTSGRASRHSAGVMSIR